MDSVTTYLTAAIVLSALAAIIGTLINSWFAKRRIVEGEEKIKTEVAQRKYEEPITSELPEVPGKYGQLKIVKGGLPQSWTLEQPTIKIGRTPEMDIYLDSPSVSRNHALIERKNGKFFISDCASRNGTTVNGQKIKKASELHDGAVIEIGQIKLLFSVVEVEKNDI